MVEIPQYAGSHRFALGMHPISTSDSKPRASNYPSLAPLDVDVDKQLQFPELLLAVGNGLPGNCYCTLSMELGVGRGSH
jgi:hypothetical protein